jgi:hypothetical protein
MNMIVPVPERGQHSAAGQRWYVLQIERHSAKPVEGFLDALEFPSLFPMLIRRRHIKGRMVEDEIPRFGPYILVRFDAACDPWGHLLHSKGKRVGIIAVLLNGQMQPSPVPDEAVWAIRNYQPEPLMAPSAYRYTAGEPCIVTLAGQRREGIFVGYCGSRPRVRIWIFGAERVAEVAACELEPRKLDSGKSLTAESRP